VKSIIPAEALTMILFYVAATFAMLIGMFIGAVSARTGPAGEWLVAVYAPILCAVAGVFGVFLGPILFLIAYAAYGAFGGLVLVGAVRWLSLSRTQH
jgi:hypothetical protein